LLNVLNGTIDLRTGTMTPHRPEDRITKLAPVVFDPAARCPLWDSFLNTIMADEQAKTRYLQRILGMCLTGDVREQALFLFYGTGANGKSVSLDTMTGLMGDYATEAAPDLLIERRNPEHPTEQADLCGRRLVVASETEEGGRLRVQLIKRLTGNARIKARYMRQDFFEFTRTHKLVMATNNKPAVRETTHAVWRRLKLIPFTVTIPDLEQDKNLLDKLRAERPGILNWAIAGCLAWQRGGLDTPEAVDKATAEYESEQDPLTDFLAERCIVDKAAFVTRADIYKAYTAWAEAAGERFILDKNNFYGRLRLKHFADGARRVAGISARGFEGIGLRAELYDNAQA
jgi:putative DNA primase/helicase